MYIQTPEMRARAIDGWDALVIASAVTMEVELDPACLTKNGQSTIRRWLRKGYCERFSGALPAYFISMMYLMNARFIMRDDGTNTFVRVFDDKIMRDVAANDGHFAAMYKLIRASQTSHNGESLVNLNVHDGNDSPTASYAMSTRKWAGNLQFYGKEHHLLREQFIQQFGPPVEEPDHGLNLFKQVHRLRIAVNQQDNTHRQYPKRLTTCKVQVL